VTPFNGYGGPYDFRFLEAPSFSIWNLIFDGSGNRSIFAVKHRDNQVVGEWVCKYGITSGYSCGLISDKNYHPGDPMNNTLIRVHLDGHDLSQGGDSGGPWFYGDTAFGVHVGEVNINDAYYMAINYLNDYGLTVLTSNEIYLPIVFNNVTESLSRTYPMDDTAYPAPQEEGASTYGPLPTAPNPYP